MRNLRTKRGLLFLARVLALGLGALVWAAETGSSQAQQGAMQDCPQAGKWAIAVWDGDDGTDAEQAFATCGEGAVAAAYYLDPETQGWLRWFAGRPDVSNLETLDNMQGVVALGGAATTPSPTPSPTATPTPPAPGAAMQNCPQPGKWAIAVWDGDDGTDAEQAFATCGEGAVAAAYSIHPDTQVWSRWFAGRPEISNVNLLDNMQGVILLGGAAAPSAPTNEQLAFVGSDGGIWVVNSDGSGLRKFAVDACAGTDGGSARDLVWSPTGDKLACICSGPNYERSLGVFDEAGQMLASIEDALWFYWSPDGSQIAYQFSPQGVTVPSDVRLLDIVTLQERVIVENGWLRAWPLPNRLLVGTNVRVEPEGLGVLRYEANWLNLETDELQRIPRFDDGAQFWLSPDAQWAVVLQPREEPGRTVAIYDLLTAEEEPIAGSSIGYPSEGIPTRQVAFSPDGSTVYWADAKELPVVIWGAKADGSGLTRLGSVDSFFVAVSRHGKVAYVVADSGGGMPTMGTVVIEDLATDTRTEVGEALWTRPWSTVSWGPTTAESGS